MNRTLTTLILVFLIGCGVKIEQKKDFGNRTWVLNGFKITADNRDYYGLSYEIDGLTKQHIRIKIYNHFYDGFMSYNDIMYDLVCTNYVIERMQIVSKNPSRITK